MDNLVSSLTQLIVKHLQSSPETDREHRARDAGSSDINDQARLIAEDLTAQALEHGLEVKVRGVTQQRLGEGSTAQLVARLIMPLSFVFKLDDSPNLIDEARLMRRFRSDDRLPSNFRNRFPQVFALRDNEKPFAYLMEDFAPEDGYVSLSQRLFQASSEEAYSFPGVVNQVLDALFECYEGSVNPRLFPNINADYLQRINERVTEAAELDSVFESRRLMINGMKIPPWKEQLDEISVDQNKLRRLTPSFLCAVHGDPNPENIILRHVDNALIIKLIDPKAWESGDYLFDLTKVAHYLWATGPVEQMLAGRLVMEGSVIDYSIDRPIWVETLCKLIYDRALSFAVNHGDATQFDLRWQLGMAANLLGLPSGRWKHGKHEEAKILYAEGLIWLAGFRKAFSTF